MKKLLISTFAFFSLVGCVNNGVDEMVDNDPVAIQLGAGVQTNVVAGTRAAIGNGDTFTATVLGWETSASVDSYSGAPTWITNTGNITASTTANPISFEEGQYYQSDGGKTFMVAISPVLGKTPTEGVYSFASSLSQDGSVDVLISDPVSGTKSAVASTLGFKHALTQLTFKVIKDASIPDSDIDQVKAISIENIQLPTGFSVSTGKLVFGENIPVLDILKVADPAITIPSSNAAAVKAGNSVMVAPIADLTKLVVKVTTNHGDFTVANITSSTPGIFNAGVSYTIQLSFKRTEISSASATVTEWTTGTGSGTVE